MKYLKYCYLILLWLLIKPLSIIVSILITYLWMTLFDIKTWWSYLLYFIPTITMILFLLGDYTEFRKSEDLDDFNWIYYLKIFVLGFMSFIPSALISMFIIFYSIFKIKFPNKYSLENLKTKSTFTVFIDLIGFKNIIYLQKEENNIGSEPELTKI